MLRFGGAHVCANCKPIYVQKLSEGAPLQSGGLNYAGFWIRFAAKFVDGLILGVPLIVIFLFVVFRSARAGRPDELNPVLIILQAGLLPVNLAYQVFFLGKYGATPGKNGVQIESRHQPKAVDSAMDAPPDGSSPNFSAVLSATSATSSPSSTAKRELCTTTSATRVSCSNSLGHESDFPCLHQMPGPACG